MGTEELFQSDLSRRSDGRLPRISFRQTLSRGDRRPDEVLRRGPDQEQDRPRAGARERAQNDHPAFHRSQLRQATVETRRSSVTGGRHGWAGTKSTGTKSKCTRTTRVRSRTSRSIPPLRSKSVTACASDGFRSGSESRAKASAVPTPSTKRSTRTSTPGDGDR